MTNLGLISAFLTDEFHDGVLGKYAESTVTYYAMIKSLRKEFKENANRRIPLELWEPQGFFPEVMHETFMYHSQIQDPFTELQVRGVLSQTRGCGTPPPIVALQSKIKFINTVVETPTPLTKTERALIRGSVRSVIAQIPDDAFTGLATKAGVKAASSSCYEKTRSEGGTVQAIHDIVWEGSLGRACRTLDLATGEVLEEKTIQNTTVGEYIFWRSLEEVLATPLDELRKVFVVMAQEPGKTRSVTKGHASLKVVLDVVNAICSWPLAKGLISSNSGMGKEAHAWNFVKTCFSEFSDLVFREKSVTTEQVDGRERRVTRTYHEVFALSTDYETATDFMLHKVAEIISGEWMSKYGIPPLLQGLVKQICYRPREIKFYASKCLEQIGTPSTKDGVRKVKLVRGVLMGDPLTKVVLHLLNAGVRELAEKINNVDFLATVTRKPQQFAEAVPKGTTKLPTEYSNS
jgi:hypothetical protein